MSPVATFELVLVLLAAVVVLELAARRLRLPPAAAFVLGGIGLALLPGSPGLELDPELALVLFLPPLLMSSAFFTGLAGFPGEFADHPAVGDRGGGVHDVGGGGVDALGDAVVALGGLFCVGGDRVAAGCGGGEGGIAGGSAAASGGGAAGGGEFGERRDGAGAVPVGGGGDVDGGVQRLGGGGEFCVAGGGGCGGGVGVWLGGGAGAAAVAVAQPFDHREFVVGLGVVCDRGAGGGFGGVVDGGVRVGDGVEAAFGVVGECAGSGEGDLGGVGVCFGVAGVHSDRVAVAGGFGAVGGGAGGVGWAGVVGDRGGGGVAVRLDVSGDVCAAVVIAGVAAAGSVSAGCGACGDELGGDAGGGELGGGVGVAGGVSGAGTSLWRRRLR